MALSVCSQPSSVAEAKKTCKFVSFSVILSKKPTFCWAKVLKCSQISSLLYPYGEQLARYPCLHVLCMFTEDHGLISAVETLLSHDSCNTCFESPNFQDLNNSKYSCPFLLSATSPKEMPSCSKEKKTQNKTKQNWPKLLSTDLLGSVNYGFLKFTSI